MITLRSLKINRKINDQLIEDHSFRIIKNNIIDDRCFLCNVYENSDEKKIKINIHKECFNKLLKCSHNNCPQYYLKGPICILCSKTYCYYHLFKDICFNCNETYLIYVLFVLKKTILYDYRDILNLILQYFPKKNSNIFFIT